MNPLKLYAFVHNGHVFAGLAKEDVETAGGKGFAAVFGWSPVQVSEYVLGDEYETEIATLRAENASLKKTNATLRKGLDEVREAAMNMAVHLPRGEDRERSKAVATLADSAKKETST